MIVLEAMTSELRRYYTTADGVDLFACWLDALKDRQARARISARLVRLNNGNIGDCKPVGEGVWELRVDWGPGYRVYYAIENQHAILLCEGGDKRSQATDIKRAIERWQDWQRRSR